MTAEELRAILSYDASTGQFRWLNDCRLRHYLAGDLAGARNGKRGQQKIQINGVGYYSHRLAWLYVHGRWPSQYIDHINGDPSDNRLCNLREATPLQNQANLRLKKAPRSGFIGVYQSANGRKFKARIHVDGVHVHVGSFDCPHIAAAAYLAVHRYLHGEFSSVQVADYLSRDITNCLPTAD